MNADRSYNKKNFGVDLIQSSSVFKYLKIIHIVNEGLEDMKMQIYETKGNEFQQNKYLDIIEILYYVMKPPKNIDNVSKKSIDNFIGEQRFASIQEDNPVSHKRNVQSYVSPSDDKSLLTKQPKKSRFSRIKSIFSRKKGGAKKETRKKR